MKEGNLIFKHRESGKTISLDTIKYRLDRNAVFNVPKSEHTQTPPGKEFSSEPLYDHIVYEAKLIPVSTDFELILLDDEFGKEEFYTLEHAMRLSSHCYSNSNDVLLKIKDKINAMLRKECLGAGSKP